VRDGWFAGLAVVPMMVPDAMVTVGPSAAGAASAVERKKKEVSNIVNEQRAILEVCRHNYSRQRAVVKYS